VFWRLVGALEKLVRLPLAWMGKKMSSIPIVYKGVFYATPESMLLSNYLGTTNLTSLSEGNHQITVYSLLKIREISYYRSNSETVYFTVDRPPNITILITENKTYQTPDLSLNFTINKPTSKITYSLDGRENVTITGNTTLTSLSNGYHNLTVYATDEIGTVGASETFFFQVDVPFPIIPVASSIAIIVVAGVGLLIYFKKHKR
jgi:hypothetical protein